MRKILAVAALFVVGAIAYSGKGQKTYDDPPPCILTNTCGMPGGN